jgi:hypothetical protein
MRRSLIVFALVAPLAACAGDPPGSPYDDDFALSSEDPLFDGAPDNDTLPDENKADAEYPATFDLVSEQSSVKSQGSRGVCSIFATTALMENLYIKAGVRDADFSEQYMQWSAKEQVRDFRNTDGSNASANLRAASDFGIVEERFWPYQSSPWTASQRSGLHRRREPAGPVLHQRRAAPGRRSRRPSTSCRAAATSTPTRSRLTSPARSLAWWSG